MTIGRFVAVLLILVWQSAAQADTPRSAPKPDDRLKADVLLIVAHPDDETGVSAYLAQLLDQGKHVAAVYLTHGEAGHNNMGRERGISLGLAREMELRHALTQLGVQNVWVLDGRDTPSQDVLQSLGNWGHGKCLEEVVRIVRVTRPDVIIALQPGFFIGENHGDHQASGVIATEAFDSAGDPSVFPAQLAAPRHVNETLLEGLTPWQPQKLYFVPDAADDKLFKGKGPEYPTSAISPTRHLPYWRVAMDIFRFHRTQYRSYIEKLDAMNEEQLKKIAAADQDGWDSPIDFVFGKSNVPSSVTGDIFEAVSQTPISFVRTPVSSTPQHSGLSMSLGGPWAYYEDFRRAHDLTNLPQAQEPEIGVAAGSTLQFPLILRNDTKAPAEISLSMTLPEGWTQKDPAQRYQLGAGDVFATQIELSTPAKKSEKGQTSELSCRASSAGATVGTVNLRVHLGTGGLPQ
jgi:LmbE family N-acetylglucosaminyl deacetylase